ncbi:predicted protein [Arabidopsis lyrata subsp. lyrata]|uniref:Predicted protein n=1 Tax=Arabidopsis lyrata subsp. lyrata TaxID=81972 RepID=D7MU44_ARALL|nr:predicted protein [Arabidopsis lyrata subsp. lyrata]
MPSGSRYIFPTDVTPSEITDGLRTSLDGLNSVGNSSVISDGLLSVRNTVRSCCVFL